MNGITVYENSGITMVINLARFLSAREWSQFSSESGPKTAVTSEETGDNLPPPPFGWWWEVIPCLLLGDRHLGSHFPWKIVTIPRHSVVRTHLSRNNF